nr:phage head-tail connector protein [uncultured Albidiferax sp.]
MPLQRLTAPTEPAVTLTEAKAHLRVDIADDDLLIAALVTAATEAAEHQLERALMPQTWVLSLDAFSAQIPVHLVPVQSVIGITYIDTEGNTQTLGPSSCSLSNTSDYAPASIQPAYGTTWPATRAQPDSVRITVTAGYPSADQVPEPIKSWIKLLVGTLYANRESETIQSASAITLGIADRLLDRYRTSWGL